MAEEISKTYPPVAEPVATFDSEDLASGTGVVNYFPLVGKNAAGFTFSLSESELDSWLPQTTRSATGTTTLTFDSGVFNLPRFVKGTAIFSAYIEAAAAANAVNCTAQLWHWDGTTATAMTAKATSGNCEANDVTYPVYLELPVTTEKMIKKGEQVRLIVELTKTGVNDSWIGHSPTGQAVTAGGLSSTKMVMGVPFRIGV